MKSRALSLFLLAGIVIVPVPVSARMYQWVDPDTGTTQWSGRPPAWYRGSQRGPRVLVFDGGRLIDDTARRVPDAERDVLRTQAFALEPEAPTPTADAPAAGADAEPSSPIEAAGPKAAPVEGPKAGAEVSLPGVDQATIERLKAIIGEWDRRQTQEAKRFLEGQAIGAPGAPSTGP
ncbi:MAG: hypothetical protein ACREXX_14135 [Gammaproteobacteria bacterium]